MICSMSCRLFLSLFLLAFLDLVEIISNHILGVIQSFLQNLLILVHLFRLFLLIYDFLSPVIGLRKQQLFFLNLSIGFVFVHVFTGDFIEIFLDSFALETLVWLLAWKTSKVVEVFAALEIICTLLLGLFELFESWFCLQLQGRFFLFNLFMPKTLLNLRRLHSPNSFSLISIALYHFYVKLRIVLLWFFNRLVLSLSLRCFGIRCWLPLLSCLWLQAKLPKTNIRLLRLMWSCLLRADVFFVGAETRLLLDPRIKDERIRRVLGVSHFGRFWPLTVVALPEMESIVVPRIHLKLLNELTQAQSLRGLALGRPCVLPQHFSKWYALGLHFFEL